MDVRRKPEVLPDLSGHRLAVVLGLGRSGTSTFARALQTMGVALGDRLTPPELGVNDKGFWEDEDFLNLNVEMLDLLRTDWFHSSPMPIEPEHVALLREHGYVQRAAELLASKTNGAPLFGFKDGRTTKLIPFWRSVFEGCQVGEVVYLVAMRNPLSVAQSYAKYLGLDPARIYLLWPGFMIAALRGCHGHRSVLADYDRLLRDPQRELHRIAEHLDLSIDTGAMQQFVRKFLDQHLRHTMYTTQDLSKEVAAPVLVKELYAQLLRVASGQARISDAPFQRLLKGWHREYERLDAPRRLIDRLYRETEEAQLQRVRWVEEGAERDQRLGRQEATIGQLQGSLEEATAELQRRMSQVQDLKARLEQALLALDQQQAQFAGAAARQKATICELDHSLQETAQGARQLAAQQQAVIAALREVAAQRASEVQKLRASRSWRITRPLRALSTLARRWLLRVAPRS